MFEWYIYIHTHISKYKQIRPAMKKQTYFGHYLHKNGLIRRNLMRSFLNGEIIDISTNGSKMILNSEMGDGHDLQISSSSFGRRREPSRPRQHHLKNPIIRGFSTSCRDNLGYGMYHHSNAFANSGFKRVNTSENESNFRTQASPTFLEAIESQIPQNEKRFVKCEHQHVKSKFCQEMFEKEGSTAKFRGEEVSPEKIRETRTNRPFINSFQNVIETETKIEKNSLKKEKNGFKNFENPIELKFLGKRNDLMAFEAPIAKYYNHKIKNRNFDASNIDFHPSINSISRLSCPKPDINPTPDVSLKMSMNLPIPKQNLPELDNDADFLPEEQTYSELKAGSISTRFANMFKTRNSPIELDVLTRRFGKALRYCDLKAGPMEGLQNLLIKFLKCEPLSKKDITISELETLLFLFFLVKKKYMNVQKMIWSVEHLNKMKFKTRKRRNEQNYKMILKRFFKLVIQEFNESRGLPETEEDAFYKYYFDAYNDHPTRLKFQFIFNESQQRYTEPDQRRQSKKFYAKTLHESHEFMDLLDRFLKDDLVLDNRNSGVLSMFGRLVELKTKLLVQKWSRYFCRPGDLRQKLVAFVGEGLCNTKLKLPWGLNEIRRGVETIQELFELK